MLFSMEAFHSNHLQINIDRSSYIILDLFNCSNTYLNVIVKLFDLHQWLNLSNILIAYKIYLLFTLINL